jgi:2-oxoglutarate/2-oxoacid ferredoxin oxidoreductase subunit alpha
MDRLMVKWETAKKIVPSAQLYQKKNQSSYGILFFGTSTFSSEEAKDLLLQQDVVVDAIRIKAFPFGTEVVEFVNTHELVFVIEQNRDAQMRSMMMIEMETNPAKLIPVLNYDGMPITADAIKNQITNYLQQSKSLDYELSKTTV